MIRVIGEGSKAIPPPGIVDAPRGIYLMSLIKIKLY